MAVRRWAYQEAIATAQGVRCQHHAAAAGLLLRQDSRRVAHGADRIAQPACMTDVLAAAVAIFVRFSRYRCSAHTGDVGVAQVQ